MRDPTASQPHASEVSPGFRGSNQSGMRAYNERLVLSLIRRFGPLAKAEIARRTGLSAQTISVIIRALELDGLLSRGDPVRGRIGQPSVPMQLEPKGAFFFGLKVGRRSAEIALIDFVGSLVGKTRSMHEFPTPDAAVRFAKRGIAELSRQLDPEQRSRISGMGIGLPFQLWDWAGRLGISPEAMAAWRERDIRAEIAADVEFPVFLENDASAACNAEIAFGAGDAPQDFLYAYIGFFAGGGVVLDGSLLTGRSGNAGALGSMPVPGGDGGSVQLLDTASLWVLEEMLGAAGCATGSLWISPEDWSVDKEILQRWIDRAGRDLAFVTASAAALLDLEAVLIDGWMSADLRRRVVSSTAAALERIDLSGIRAPRVAEGTVGQDARTIGAASVPLSKRFLVDRGTLARTPDR